MSSLLLVAGGLILLSITPYGSGLLGDSYAYLAASDNLAHGGGYGVIDGGGTFKVLTQYPPFFPFVLSLLQRSGVGSLETVRWVNALSIGALGALGYWAVRMSAAGKGFAALAGSLLVTSPILLEIGSWAMSEPLFLLLMLGALVALAQYLTTGSLKWLWWVGALMGLAGLTRYAGLALPAAGLVCLVWARPRRAAWTREAAILVGLGLGPCLLWIARNAYLVGNPVNRRVLWEPPGWVELKAVVLSGLAWFFPKSWIRGQWVALALILILAVLAALLLWARRNFKRPSGGFEAPIDRTLTVGAAVYLGFVVAARTFADPRIPVDQRLLSPIYVSAMILGVLLLSTGGLAGRWARGGSWFLAGFLLVSHVGQSIPIAQRLSLEGQGLAHRAWSRSPVMTAVRSLPPETILYTNEIPALYIHTGRSAFSIPWRIDSITGQHRPSYEADLERMRMRMHYGAVLVLFLPGELFPEQASLEDMTDGMRLIVQFAEGVLYSGDHQQENQSGRGRGALSAHTRHRWH